MIAYKKHKFDGQITNQIIRINDDESQSIIPTDPMNSDRIAYEEWVAEGNTPQEADD
tara:strand:- start:200 stop:370 length:171 start_codon:yes stop_codon:yes gene_type:complete